MAKKVQVTSAQRRAAQTIVERSAVTGRYVRPGVSKIVESAGGTHRSAVAGRYVTSATAARHPRSTVTESSSNTGRSATSTTASYSPDS